MENGKLIFIQKKYLLFAILKIFYMDIKIHTTYLILNKQIVNDDIDHLCQDRH